MIKWVLLVIGIVIVISSGYAILSNGFSNIESIKVQKFDKDKNDFNEGKIIKDNSTIKNLTKMLNRANHEKNVNYEMVEREDYKITVIYENGTTDGFLVWNHEGLNVFLMRPSKSDVLRIKNEVHIKGVLEILA